MGIWEHTNRGRRNNSFLPSLIHPQTVTVPIMETNQLHSHILNTLPVKYYLYISIMAEMKNDWMNGGRATWFRDVAPPSHSLGSPLPSICRLFPRYFLSSLKASPFPFHFSPLPFFSPIPALSFLPFLCLTLQETKKPIKGRLICLIVMKVYNGNGNEIECKG